MYSLEAGKLSSVCIASLLNELNEKINIKKEKKKREKKEPAIITNNEILFLDGK